MSFLRRRFRLLLALILGFVLATKVVEWTTEAWFFDSLGQAAVFQRAMTARCALFVCGVAWSGLIIGWNLRHARHVAARHHAAPEQRLIPLRDKKTLDRYRRFWGGALLALALLFCGAYAAAHWLVFLRLFAAAPTGTQEPVFWFDVSFYLFVLPALNFVWTFVNATLWMALIAVGVFYIYEEVIEAAGKYWRIAYEGLQHIGALGVALLLWKSLGYRLSAWNLLTARGASAEGFDWTAQTIRLPLFAVLAALSALAAWLLWRASSRGESRRSWRVPFIWLSANLLLGTFVPWAVQRLYVAPNRALLEKPFLEMRREATARAYGLDNVASWTRKANSDSAIRQAAAGLPLWPQTQLLAYLNANHRRGDYVFTTLHFDRYNVGGETRPVFVAARERIARPSAAGDWRGEHGYSVMICDAQRRTPEGEPLLYASSLTHPEIIFGELPLHFSAWPPSTASPESAGPSNPLPDVLTRRARPVAVPTYAILPPDYYGSGSITFDSWPRRLLLTWRFFDWQFLSAPSDAQLAWHRRVTERCSAVAPFLLYEEPRLVVNRGRLTWLVNALSVADAYPLAASLQGTRLNAFRCAAVVTVDAYDGTTNFYAADESDALMQSYRRLFPALFHEWSDLPDELRSHLTYSSLLLGAQSDVWARWLAPSADEVLRNEKWEVAALRRRSRWNVIQMVPLPPQLMQLSDELLALQMFTRPPIEDKESALNGDISGMLLASLSSGSESYQPQIRQWSPPNPLSITPFDKRPVQALAIAPVGDSLLLHAHTAGAGEQQQSWLLLGKQQLRADSLDAALASRWLTPASSSQ